MLVPADAEGYSEMFEPSDLLPSTTQAAPNRNRFWNSGEHSLGMKLLWNEAR
jgi:hypothetical protein